MHHKSKIIRNRIRKMANVKVEHITIAPATIRVLVRWTHPRLSKDIEHQRIVRIDRSDAHPDNRIAFDNDVNTLIETIKIYQKEYEEVISCKIH